MNSDPLDRLREAAAAREVAGLRRRLRARRADEPVLDLASNDYLGLARDSRVSTAAAAAALLWGAGSTGSRLVTGSIELHEQLEAALAAFTGAASGLVFSSGYLANLGAVTALAGPGVRVVSDAGNHASVIDACRLSRSQVSVTPHCDLRAVEAALANRPESHAVVVTDAVFSVAGDLAPIRNLHEITRRHGALLIVDEAHALGVVGAGGRGAVDAAGLSTAPDIVRTVTLSKALGAQGGAVLGATEIIDTLVDTARAFIFDTGLTPGAVGAALAALQILESEPHLAGQARRRALELAAAAAAAGSEPSSPDAAVVRVVLGSPQAALRSAGVCRDHGVHVGCFRPPSVPADASCLRLTARANLTDDDVALAATALQAAAAAQGTSMQ